MADGQPPADPTGDVDAGGTPRWVKIFAATALVLVVAVTVLLVAGGRHGPGRHAAAVAHAQP